MIRIFGFLCLVAAVFPAPAAALQDTPARAAIVLDLASGAVLLEKNADEALPPASMSKLMTVNMVFEALKAGRLALSDEFRTSAKASKMGGSKMFIRSGEIVNVADLLRGVIVQSGNDAAVALAEALSGSEEAFAKRMTERAADLGMTNSVFSNATGWPHPDHRMSVRDIATLSARLATQFPDYYPMFAETEFTWDGIVQQNRNPLLDRGVGVDGLKTGHTQEAGYGLAASAVRGKRRVVVVVAGLDTVAMRARESERLIIWAFRAFETRPLFAAGGQIAEFPVWLGEESRVAVAPENDVTLLTPAGATAKARLSVIYDSPAPAPIAKGDRLGKLRIEAPELSPVHIPLVAIQDVAEGGIASRVRAARQLLLTRVLGGGG